MEIPRPVILSSITPLRPNFLSSAREIHRRRDQKSCHRKGCRIHAFHTNQEYCLSRSRGIARSTWQRFLCRHLFFRKLCLVRPPWNRPGVPRLFPSVKNNVHY